MATEYQSQLAVLIAPSDEQAWPSFHIIEDLQEAFLGFLHEKGVELVLPPENLGPKGPFRRNLVEIEVAERHAVEELEELLQEFVSTHPINIENASSCDVNVGRTERLVCLLGGVLLGVAGIAQRNTRGAALALVGGALAYRGIKGQCPLYTRLGLDTSVGHHRGVPGNHGIKVERTIHIHRSPSQVYGYWRKLENLPRFISHLQSVEEHGNGRSHWKAVGPAGSIVEWEAETIIDRPGELISWQSVSGSEIDNAGSVWFQPEDTGTRMKVAMQYQPPAGLLGGAVARLFHRAPDQQLNLDLIAFKNFVESDDGSVA